MFKSEESSKWCPLIKKDCVERKCAWYMHIRGMDPNTGKDVDHWGCAIGWMPMLLIENSQQQRSTGAAVESFRNEMVKSNESNQQILEGVANMYLDICEAQGINIQMLDQNGEDQTLLDNKDNNLLPQDKQENEE
jgi:hypothetical protein